MQSILSLSSHGVPLCVSPISARFPLSKRIKDHDRRREAMKRRMRSMSVTPQGVLAMHRVAQNGVVAQDLALAFRFFVDVDDDDDVSCTAAKAA